MIALRLIPGVFEPWKLTVFSARREVTIHELEVDEATADLVTALASGSRVQVFCARALFERADRGLQAALNRLRRAQCERAFVPWLEVVND